MAAGKTYGIVFSGGGALGAWEVGCYDAIRAWHADQLPAVVTGASAGSINATAVCAGMSASALAGLWAAFTPEKMFSERFSARDVLAVLRGAMRRGLTRKGLVDSVKDFLSRHQNVLDNQPFEKMLRSVLSNAHYAAFANSPTYFAVSVTNLTNSKRQYFYKVPLHTTLPQDAFAEQVDWTRITSLEILLDALVGSTSVPVIFPPRKGAYFDGGVLLNQPISAAMLLKKPEPDILYVVIPAARALGETKDILQIAVTLLSTWTARSLVTQLGVVKVTNKLRPHINLDPLPICVIRPNEDLSSKFDVGILEFGKEVGKLVADGKRTTDAKLRQFDASNDLTWYDV